MGKKKITDEIRAKHVFGELTLKDIIPFVKDKCKLVTVVEFMHEDAPVGSAAEFVDFTWMRSGLELWHDFDDGEPQYSFPYETKVKAKDDCIVLESGEEVYFCQATPIKINILGSRKKPA